MSRRRAAEKRAILPDAKFGDPVITKFINCLMMQGKKSAAGADCLFRSRYDWAAKRRRSAENVS